MITSSRSFEHRGYATKRTHLMPVVRDVRNALFAPPSHERRAGWIAGLLFVLAFASLLLIGAIV